MKYAPIIAKLILVLPLLMFVPTTSHAATATIKIYPTDDAEQELYDDDNQTLWSAARSYTGSFTRPVNSTSEALAIRSDAGTGIYRLYRASLLFDTRLIPANATVQSATLNVYKVVYGNNTPIVLTQHTRVSTTTFASSDWQESHYGSEIARGILNVDQYTAFDLNSVGLSYLNIGGYTDIGVRTAFDYDNIDPGNIISAAGFASSEAAGTSTDPYLEITYTVADTIVTLPIFEGVIDSEITNSIKNSFFKMRAEQIMSDIAAGNIQQAKQQIKVFITLLRAKNIDSSALNTLIDRLLLQIG